VKAPVRVGDTARRPRSENSEFIHQVLRHLESIGVDWAPRSFGFDELDREVLSWISGETPRSGEDIDLFVLTGMVRQLHDLTTSLVDGFESVIHDDLQPRNIVVRGRRPVGLIDWEEARPGRRMEDVAKLCWSFVEPRPDSNPLDVGRKWRALVATYGLNRNGDLLQTILSQIAACAEDIERQAERSVRHHALAIRGDHIRLRALNAWVGANEEVLRKAVDV
jgi:aminoglycoside phosphotransferase (APT) family kinase protein